ncbi:MAG: phenylalanine--tRNA ligase subunit beta [Candidatus Diapherotrites archaeon]|uniref:phenylalanine--tRNA ligase n=1 Tax=Candidatus Iainarchaeum sp. TaxID=3101447 RepID=A0A8T3YPJ0_9ARCH|nr:phenylalanine--tRNA ligase subunit beta [Candidatus Diapherotrites archaeon]
MPTIEFSKKDMESLLGKKLSWNELEDALMYVKGEIDAKDGDNVKADVKETLRPDIWSAEGIARELRARTGMEKGLPKYKAAKAKISCTIEKSVEKARPFIACAVIRDVKVTDDLLLQMIQLQEKVGTTFGRKRKEAGIGLYDFDRMTPPIYYRGCRDDEIEYIPLDFRAKMRPSEILAEHPKGKEFGHLLKGSDLYPIVIDSAGVVASMPPIINSEATGKVTEKTRNIFIESTGYDWEKANIALKVMCMALADRGGKIEAVKINFPKTGAYPKSPAETPFFMTKSIEVEPVHVRKISGLDISDKEMIVLLEKAKYSVKKKGKKLRLEYPDYRNDIMHPVDVVEDILIGYNYNRIRPQRPKMSVIGEERKETSYLDKARDACVGLGLQEVLTFNLTSREKQETMAGLGREEYVEIANPVSANWSILRKRAYPELLEFLGKNRGVEYPHRIFEIATTLEIDNSTDTKTRERKKLCIALAGKGYGFTVIKSIFEAVCRELGKKCSLSETTHPSLTAGRAAEIKGDSSGFIGELSDKVRANFGIEQQVILLEMEL